ncbi:uncharacterized protein LOC134820916 [Bolinopsis microptera]|uniref:uncharacterized protein LOC134820916 n=1 Tax=Bolinopsis microptera TaxID=2820187 RepID=UPI0030795211
MAVRNAALCCTLVTLMLFIMQTTPIPFTNASSSSNTSSSSTTTSSSTSSSSTSSSSTTTSSSTSSSPTSSPTNNHTSSESPGGEAVGDVSKFCKINRTETDTCFLGDKFTRGCCEKQHFCCGNVKDAVCCHKTSECKFDQYGKSFYCHHQHWISLTSIPAYWLVTLVTYLVLNRKLRRMGQKSVMVGSSGLANGNVQFTVTNPTFTTAT